MMNMASLQRIGTVFHLRFRFGGQPYRRSLGTAIRDDADSTKKQVVLNLHRIKVWLNPPPPPGADVPPYVISGGKEGIEPSETERPTLAKMWENNLESLPPGAKDDPS